jgi:hypothetical protein
MQINMYLESKNTKTNQHESCLQSRATGDARKNNRYDYQRI